MSWALLKYQIYNLCQIIIVEKNIVELLLNHLLTHSEHNMPAPFKFTLTLTFNPNMRTINKIVPENGLGMQKTYVTHEIQRNS